MNKVVLLLGSNMGERHTNIKKASISIEHELGKIVQSSSVYETEPWGNTQQQHFLNQVIIISSDLTSEELMKKIISIEEKSGRIRKIKWEPRIVDIDVLFFNNETISTKILTVPHPGLHLRKFALIPLVELIPEFNHPVLKKSMTELLHDLKDPLEVKKKLTQIA